MLSAACLWRALPDDDGERKGDEDREQRVARCGGWCEGVIYEVRARLKEKDQGEGGGISSTATLTMSFPSGACCCC